MADAALAAHPKARAVIVFIACAGIAAGAAIGIRVRLPAGASAPAATDSMAGMPGMAESPPPTPEGASSSAVYITPAHQQLIGVRTGLVEHQRAAGTVRTVGVLAYDETRVAQIHTKVAGWVDRLFVDYVGKPVRRGQALFSVYSPDLVTAQADYLVALRAHKQLGGASGDAAFASDALLTAAHDRLGRWDVSDAQIAALEKSGQPSRSVSLSSPFDGVLLEKSTYVDQYITPDMVAFKIADLSTLWAVGQAFESEALAIRVGQPVDIEFPNGQSSGTLAARIDFVSPDVDPQTRRVRFRASVDNRTLHLKPDTYVQLVVHGEDLDRLVVPKEAIIDTGTRRYALVALADGYFDPRTVDVGPPLGDVYPVVSGLAEGERVVTSAQFLVDSETNLMSAMQNMAMTMPGMTTGPSQPAPAAKPMPPMPGMSAAPPPGPAPSRTAPPPRPPASMPSPPAGPSPPPAPPSSSAPVPPMPGMPDMPGMVMPMPSGMPMPPSRGK
jgi:membrane fusion protein, copper/silver efflux system